MSTTIKCVAKRMAGGAGHEHISMLWWVRHENGADVGETGNSTREKMVSYIEQNGNNAVWCPDRNPQLQVHGCTFITTAALNTFKRWPMGVNRQLTRATRSIDIAQTSVLAWAGPRVGGFVLTTPGASIDLQRNWHALASNFMQERRPRFDSH